MRTEETQKKLVLVVVSIALLLDNMLYMVIVPIIPKYLRDIHAYEVEYVGYHNETTRLKNGTILVRMEGGQIDYLDEEIELGWLFASKALLQIFVNPFSGFIIDRIGYELPMIIGLIVMFSSTAIFALGRSYGVLFFARSLQGFGSAFADTSGLAMIADRFTEESERSMALGIALAFISFGCLVAPPFGSVLYSIAGKPVPFLILSFVCLIDAFMVFMVIQPKSRPSATARQANGETQGTPMWRLFMDPFIAVCSGSLIMANVSLAFLEPTITTWIDSAMPETPGWLVGMIWFPAFFPHVLGVYVTVKLLRKYPQSPWILATIGLAMEGLSCAFVPFATSVDTRHVSVYGSVYAIADISYSLAYAFGPIIAGGIVGSMGFIALNLIICFLNLSFTPVLMMLRKVYVYENLDGKPAAAVNGKPANAEANETHPMTALNNAPWDSNQPNSDGYGSIQQQQSSAYGSGSGYQQGGAASTNPFAPGAQQKSPFDPLNPEW
ncbi:major facilitator superfamily domain-containing protein [Ditylenchus destructor]|uniref:Major facilitator superfamily domain-containing protein n=1 Tax=Ditylenchus destructor TaxID=166010 RepID=A0AAD4MVJ3_9BILA|nr:major facilitator superfamily domain-containing protein [Ditylenchus destructor]